MFIEEYYSEENQRVSFTRQQASDFAKEIADDFNPIHDVDAKRFCVPGDLLFSIILAKSGLNSKMTFNFSGMVTDTVALAFPTQVTASAQVLDDNGKEYMNYAVSGEHSKCETLIDSLIRSYVEFSGHTFPQILGNLMEKNNVMINPARPMIMYQSMEIDLDTLNLTEVSLELNEQETILTVDGKRGQAKLKFDLLSNGKVVGHGVKYMVLSALREYCHEQMSEVNTRFYAIKDAYYANKK
ncbi:DUF3581 family protein [Thalassotalea sp. ND16A]|uniref:DUF3581 family protein n=1 Tax=Thalassotalea sp. ND16A TaxID=1535422 RepID=UPI00051A33DB|nr:DUF3581 family protein [Thalassotalea sp. ND16A]KGJ89227.1 hypothetical protein ND16A_2120 [Thalassotalea sp. ND16A]